MIKNLANLSHRFLPAIVGGVLLLVGAAPLQAGGMAHIEQAVQKAVVILHDPALAVPEKKLERREKLRKIIYAEFDFVAISQGAVGHRWRKFSAEQKSRFIPLFKRLLENTYINTIERYKGEKISFVREVKQSNSVVRADSVVESKGTEFKVSYLLRRNNQDWKVFDVVIEGVSVVSNYRSQFKQMLRRGSAAEIEKLLVRLNEASNKSE